MNKIRLTGLFNFYEQWIQQQYLLDAQKFEECKKIKE